MNSFLNLAEELRIDLNEKIQPEELFRRIKSKLNQFSSLNLLFIIDNLINETEDSLNDYKYLIFGLNSNIKFLIVTKDQTINTKLNKHSCKIIELDFFNLNTCFEFIEKKLNENHKSIIKEKDWMEIFTTMSEREDVKIKAIWLDKLVSTLNQEYLWELSDIKEYLKKESVRCYDLMKEKYPKAYKILCYLAFLNEDSISINVIKKILIDENLNEEEIFIIKQDLNEGLKYLIQNSEISIKSTGGFSIKETTQLELLKSIKKETNC